MKSTFTQLLRVTLLACLSVVSSLSFAQEINLKNPYTMVEQVSKQTFSRFADDQALIEKDLNHLKVIVAEELMPYVDYKYAAYKVMGLYLRESTPEQRKAFVTAFKGYLISTYAQAFTEYTDQTVKFSPALDFAGEKIVEVNVQIVEAGRPPIKIKFKARRLKDDTWKAFDLVAEGISLLASKQSEISNLIRQKGIESVITMLEDKSKQSIHPDDKAES
ncbi:phospholipid-binding protein MlaC [Shewanella intestini]|uniref:ABC transporter substrate-binding protein n=1 Tax=Shewanella intestini TaxID=2017544 RepID=A0ABS5I0T0_9GAMM|nr:MULTISPECIES: ABC transporter substrate-binding protein [Shewanella]MBR9727632.1 ABC transporter substrate-binding protein [Shewanella intestini]MRG35218.1 toluene tolerance protein [Shewanella sp. XMDDZSB0408]